MRLIRESWTQLRRSKHATVGVSIVLVLVLAAILAPVIAPYDPYYACLLYTSPSPRD